MPSPTVFIIIGLAVALLVMITLSFVPIGGKKVFCPATAVLGAKLIDSSNCAAFSKTIGNADYSNCSAFINSTSCKSYSDAATAACPAAGSGTATASAESCATWLSSQTGDALKPYCKEDWCKASYASLTTSIGKPLVCNNYVKLLDNQIKSKMLTYLSSNTYVIMTDEVTSGLTTTTRELRKGPVTALDLTSLTAWFTKSTALKTMPYSIEMAKPTPALTTVYYMLDDATEIRTWAAATATAAARQHNLGTDLERAFVKVLTNPNAPIFMGEPIADTVSGTKKKKYFVIDATKLTEEVLKTIKSSTDNTYAFYCNDVVPA
jgi:hypothetical protein